MDDYLQIVLRTKKKSILLFKYCTNNGILLKETRVVADEFKVYSYFKKQVLLITIIINKVFISYSDHYCIKIHFVTMTLDLF